MEMEQVLVVKVQEQVEVWVEAEVEAGWVVIDPVQVPQDFASVQVVVQKHPIRLADPVIIQHAQNAGRRWLENRAICYEHFCGQR
ncbi:MAG: hypothetical protein ISS43_00925 [Candidatus Omnitrophica bacterium]|nr:hypothetical protein [Candidatus Omnitrophota bacterium]